MASVSAFSLIWSASRCAVSSVLRSAFSRSRNSSRIDLGAGRFLAQPVDLLEGLFELVGRVGEERRDLVGIEAAELGPELGLAQIEGRHLHRGLLRWSGVSGRSASCVPAQKRKSNHRSGRALPAGCAALHGNARKRAGCRRSAILALTVSWRSRVSPVGLRPPLPGRASAASAGAGSACKMAPLSALPAAPRDRSPPDAARLERRLALGALIAVAGWVACAGGRYSYDDAFITYRMAANLAAGHGFVYNPGEWHLGSTAALYGLILAALGWLFGPGPDPGCCPARSRARRCSRPA